MKKILTLFAAVFACVLLSLGLSACGGNDDKNSLTFNTLTVDGTEVYGKVSNDTEEFSFEEEISVSGKTKFSVSLDKNANQTVVTKTVNLREGDNIVYVFELIDGKTRNTYEVTIRRRPMYTVTFETNNETEIEPQTVEEDGFAEKPNNPIKLGCDFAYWNYDFIKPITENTTITAKFEVKEEMATFTFASTATTCEITGVKDTTITEIVIPNYITSIGTSAFYGCGNLTKVVIPDNVTNIVGSAFGRCDSLTSVTIGNSVTSIGTWAFNGCYKLVEIVNKSPHITVEKGSENNGYLGYYAFAVYNSGDTFTGTKLSNDNGYIVYTDGNEKILVGYNGAETDLILPTYITKINQYAFLGYNNLTSVTMGDNITSIGDCAFESCENITTITIPNSVISIGSRAFNGCYNLVEVVNKSPHIIVEKGKPSNGGLGYYAFAVYNSNDTFTGTKLSNDNGCIVYTDGNEKILVGYNGATDLILPSYITTIKQNTFLSSPNLTSVHITDITAWCNISYGNVFANPLYHAKNLYLNEELVTNLVIPDTVTEIKPYTFYHCKSLTSVAISKSVTSIGTSAFSGCSSLTSVAIGDSVTSIASWAFEDCDSLMDIVIPDSITSIGSYAFNNCDNLTSIIVSEKNQAYRSIDGNLYSKDGKTLIQYAYGKTANSFTIPDGVTSIGVRAFDGCDSLTSVVIPDNVTSIGASAFNNCDSLTSVVIPDSVTSIGASAFNGCNSLPSVVIPDNVTSIGASAFNNCDSLTSITVSEKNPTYRSVDGNLYSKDGKTLIQYACGKTANSFTIPDGVTSIDGYAFNDCDRLTSVVIPDSVTSIDNGAFADCNGLTSVYYKGTADDWASISIISYNSDLTNATRYYYSETKPTESGNYWHYVDGVPTAW